MKKQEVNNKALGDALMGVKEELEGLKEELKEETTGLKAEVNNLKASLKEEEIWIKLARLKARLAANAPRKRFILKESVARGVRNPFKDPSVEEGDIEGPLY